VKRADPPARAAPGPVATLVEVGDKGLHAEGAARSIAFVGKPEHETYHFRLGVTENIVAKRLKLGRLSSVVLAAYRAGEIDLEEAQAFAISDDHQAQERVLAEVSEWSRNPSLIRRHLTEGEIPASDKRVRFVGLDAYQLAGGVVRRDLFDDESSGTLIDTILLDRLVSEKLADFANTVRAEGWAWVEIVADFDRSVLGDYRRVHPECIELTAEQQALFDALSEEYDTLADSAEADCVSACKFDPVRRGIGVQL